MSNSLSQLLIGVLIFTAAMAFFSSFVFQIGEVYYGTPSIPGLSALSSYDDINEKVINPFESQTQESEMVGTGVYLPYAAIPKLLSAMTSFFSLPQVLINIITAIANYIMLPSWAFTLIVQLITLTIILGVAYALVGREF